MTTVQGEVYYEAEVVGHEAPFKYKIYRCNAPGSARTWVTGGDGEADTFDEACWAAQDAARNAHQKWLHASTVETVKVFSGPAKAQDRDERSVFQRPENEPVD